MDKWLVSFAIATVVFVFGGYVAVALVRNPEVFMMLVPISAIAMVIRANFDRIFKDW